MKYRILYLIVPFFLILNNAIAFEIYNNKNKKLNIFGSTNALLYQSKDLYRNGDKSYLNLGLTGEIKINNKLIGYSNLEYYLPIKHGFFTNSFSKFYESSFIGLRWKNNNSLDYGRNYGVMYDISAWTDVLPEFGGDTYGPDNFMFQRAKGLLTYRNQNFFGLIKKLKITAQYQFKNRNLNEYSNYTYVINQNGRGFGLSLIYNLNPNLELGSAMFISHRTKDQNDYNNNGILGTGRIAQAYSGGFKYQYNDIYLAAIFAKTYNSTRFSSVDSNAYGFADKAKNWEIVTHYQFNFGLRPSLAYIHSRGTNIQFWKKQNLKRYIDLGMIYELNKSIFTYIDYKFNLLKKNDFIIASNIDLNNVLALGLVLHF